MSNRLVTVTAMPLSVKQSDREGGRILDIVIQIRKPWSSLLSGSGQGNLSKDHYLYVLLVFLTLMTLPNSKKARNAVRLFAEPRT